MVIYVIRNKHGFWFLTFWWSCTCHQVKVIEWHFPITMTYLSQWVSFSWPTMQMYFDYTELDNTVLLSRKYSIGKKTKVIICCSVGKCPKVFIWVGDLAKLRLVYLDILWVKLSIHETDVLYMLDRYAYLVKIDLLVYFYENHPLLLSVIT